MTEAHAKLSMLGGTTTDSVARCELPRSFVRRSRRVEFPGGSGHTLAGILDQPEGFDDAPVLIFSHCFTCNKDLKTIVRLSRLLCERGFSILRYDMTGLGNSAGSFATTNFSTNLADLLAAVRFSLDSIGPPRFLLGHSLGGAVSLAAAGQWPRELPLPSGVATLAAPSDTRHLADLLVRMDWRVHSEGRGEVVIGGRRWETTPQLIADLRGFDLPRRIANIQLPVLLFHSPVDETVGFDHALRILSWVGGGSSAIGITGGQPGWLPSSSPPGTKASLITLPGADHLLTNNPLDLDFMSNILAAWMLRNAR